MLNKVCKRKTDKIIEKVMETRYNQDNGNSNIACTYLKFVNFVLTIDQVIQSNLQLH